VSIGLPVYNGEKYLGEAIGSVLSQTFEDFELLISDNASTDRTEEICKKYADKDPRIRYYRNERNLGAAKNFNLVFELSSGVYFKWIAADEVIESDFLEKCVDLLDNNPSMVLAGSKYVAVNEFDNTTRNLDYDHNLRSPRAHQRFRRLVGERVGSEHPIWGVIRSSVLRRTRLIRPFIGSDSYLVVELVLQGEFGQMPEYLNRLRIHPEAYSAKFRLQNIDLDGMQGPREAKWLAPESKGQVFLPHWRRLWEYFLLVIRSKEKGGAKCIMVASLFYPLGVRLRTILTKELFFAVGLGNLYMKIRNVTKKYLLSD
jgi:glycosyltransferase involved in cell wall biosynthesis